MYNSNKCSYREILYAVKESSSHCWKPTYGRMPPQVAVKAGVAVAVTHKIVGNSSGILL